ncbi:DUF3331 domain-containing protein [Paraburkholderia caledonica]|uniref:DUF3331 domain-containing protein n=1 Tax=Paraburkholderia caledonica TaxID=134536 RepID=UPI003CB3A448
MARILQSRSCRSSLSHVPRFEWVKPGIPVALDEVQMTQATHAGQDVFESALMRLLDPSRATAVCQGATAWLRGPGRRVGTVQGGAAPGKAACVASQIRVIEVLSSSTVSVRWSDPLGGHIGEQVWCCVTARKRSSCALTGEPIGRGDRVYQPRRRGRNTPWNWDRMIHAAAIRALPSISSAREQMLSGTVP